WSWNRMSRAWRRAAVGLERVELHLDPPWLSTSPHRPGEARHLLRDVCGEVATSGGGPLVLDAGLRSYFEAGEIRKAKTDYTCRCSENKPRRLEPDVRSQDP